MLKALIFDVDGTLADTESAHLAAFNAAFHEVGPNWYWSESLYAGLLDVAGGKERLRYYWNMVDPEEAGGARIGAMIEAMIEQAHAAKTRYYTAMVGAGQVPLRPGVLRLLREAIAAQMPIALATTTTPTNIDALLRGPLGLDWRKLFTAVCDGSGSGAKKPKPDVYLAALQQLKLPASDCLAFEDSSNGLRAARAAGIATLITPTPYTVGHRFNDALLVLPHLGDPEQPLAQPIPGTAGTAQHWVDLAALRRWHAGNFRAAA